MGEKLNCPACHTELNMNSKFCPECGKPVPKPEPEPQISKAEEPKYYPPIMTIDQTADFLHISRCNVYTLINKEGLPWFPLGRDKRFLADEVLQWAKGRQIIASQKAG